MPPNALTLWVVYKHPKDHPNHYVIRRQIVSKGQVQFDRHCFLFQTLKEVHNFLPKCLTLLQPNPNDDPVIAEIWI